MHACVCAAFVIVIVTPPPPPPFHKRSNLLIQLIDRQIAMLIDYFGWRTVNLVQPSCLVACLVILTQFSSRIGHLIIVCTSLAGPGGFVVTSNAI